jgi:ligand-binding SRPBCC domain-containing protein
MGQTQLFVASSKIAAPAERVFAFHESPGALEKLTPPWEPVEFVQRPPNIKDGARAILKVGPWPFKQRWELEHRGYIQGREFHDVQISGPFRSWHHTHRMTPASANDATASILEDRIEYELPLGALGNFFGGWFVRRKLAKLFEFRHRVTKEAVEHPAPADETRSAS